MERFDIYPPCEILRPYIKQLAISESAIAKEYKVLPGTSLVIGLQYKGSLATVTDAGAQSLDGSGITGLMDQFKVFRNSADIGTVLIYFTETGAAAFFRQPIHELFGQSVSLDHFFPADGLRRFQEQLASAQTDKQRVDITERFLISNLKFDGQDVLVLAAIQHIKQHQGQVRIKDLARTLHISQSALEKRFRKVVGATPKKFASIVRLNSIVGHAPQGNLTELGYQLGYYDQAHFIKDFKHFSGETPERFFKI